MWRVKDSERVSDMTDLSRARDCAIGVALRRLNAPARMVEAAE